MLSASRSDANTLVVLPATVCVPVFAINGVAGAENRCQVEGGLDGGFWAIYMGQGPLTPEAYARIRDTALIRSTSIHEMVAAHPGSFDERL